MILTQPTTIYSGTPGVGTTKSDWFGVEDADEVQLSMTLGTTSGNAVKLWIESANTNDASAIADLIQKVLETNQPGTYGTTLTEGLRRYVRLSIVSVGSIPVTVKLSKRI